MAKTMDISSIDKLPPQNVEAEMAVLGSILIDENAISLAIEHLEESFFYKDAHKKIFACIIELYNKNNAIDIITLQEVISSKGWLDDIGGISYLTTLTNTFPTSANVEHYAKIVKSKYILRQLISTATQIVMDSYGEQGDVSYLLDKAEKMIFDISNSKSSKEIVPIKVIIKESIEKIDALYQRKEYVTGIPTGFHDFDAMTSGLHPSDLIIIAARPSMGKSALMVNIAEYMGVDKKLPLVIFSLEMSKEQLVQRFLCSHSKIDAHKLRTGFLSQSDWPLLTSAAGKFSESAIIIDDTPGISVLELRAKARRLKAQYDIQVIFIDYLQLMQSTSRSENRQQEISEISRSLKALAREINVPVVAISQLSRAVESRHDHRPMLSDLRESGAIEQDADVVVLLLREEYYNPTEDNKGIADIILAKQRNGPVGTIKLAFLKEYTKFDNLAYEQK